MAITIDLDGKVALITGGATGIGRATALALVQAGAQVVIGDIDSENGERTAGDIAHQGGIGHFIPADVSKADDVRTLVSGAVARCGRLDFAINNAAADVENIKLADCEDAMFDQVLGLNLRGVFLCMKYEIRQMLWQGHGGVIVNLSSVNAQRAQPLGAAYSASKFGLTGLTLSAAAAYAADGIRVNAVSPGCVETSMMQAKLDLLGVPRSDFEPVASQLGRYAQPDEIASAIVWMCSDQASFAIGSTLAVDGGFLL
ncbi:hypothetical protein DM806_19785 [Sphingobium lactosutens]|uniref:SDR family NAD(P)-dependent oxidoreductase n=1 Tax=Sphingobium lactosutens TaxID=522773 RepID=UPI0015BD2B1F|nr:glucose 1-dehydrogenase [Sphingobium lactosutens]NWK97855.1 hypothetical protein [Sphingobium lactosutens]